MAKTQHKHRPVSVICDLPSDAWMTGREAAQYMGTTAAALAVRRSNGNGPAYGQSGKFLRYQKRDLDQWLRNHGPATQPE